MNNNIYKLIYNEIKKYKIIYIARHIGPDPDAYASSIALRDSIKLTFKEKEVYAVGASVSRFKYFGKLDKITNYDYENSLLIVTDTPDIKRVDIDNFLSFKHVIKIDHHPKIDKFSDIEYINPDCSSASELVLNVIEKTKLKMDTSIAGYLFIGIVSDTNRFLYGCNYKSFETISKLIKKYKLEVDKLYKFVYSRPISEVRLMGHIASTLKVDKNGFAYVELDDDVLNSFNSDTSSVSILINEFNNIKDVFVWAFVSKDKSNLYKVNIRSRGPYINDIAFKHGGGGHKYASGVRTEDYEVVKSLLKDLSECASIYKENNDGDN